MRTSKQLGKQGQCKRSLQANITPAGKQDAMKAMAQKQVVMRMLRGEPMDEPGAEIDAILTQKGLKWETRSQRQVSINMYERRIKRFTAWALSPTEVANAVFPEDIENLDTTVDFFGEQIDARADYFTVIGNTAYVNTVSTGRYKSARADAEKNETYALGLLGEKLFPGKNIVVRTLHLADSHPDSEPFALGEPYDSGHYPKYSQIEFTPAYKHAMAMQHAHENEEEEDMSEAKCAGCPQYNVCHYEEPPMVIPPAERVDDGRTQLALTYDQQQVVDFEEGDAVVNAGAGAGKTLVVAKRIVELLKKGSEPEDLLLLTFTNAGAEEMTARVVKYCAGDETLIARGQNLVDPDRLTSTTFNAFCQNVINEHYEELGYPRAPRPIDDAVKCEIINDIIDRYTKIPDWNYSLSGKSGKMRGSSRNIPARIGATRAFDEIKRERFTRETVSGPLLQYSPASLDAIFMMYDAYQAALKERCMIDFEDQIQLVEKLGEIRPTLYEEMGYKHIIVDEFQDTDLPQIRLLQKIKDTRSFKSFMAVGDDCQAIFAFRHTSPEYIIHFGDYFGANHKRFNLVENYRSTEKIISFANAVADKSNDRMEKELISRNPGGSDVTVQGYYSQKKEYEAIAQDVKRRIEAGEYPSDIAILKSDKYEISAMASALTELGVPSVLMNPLPFIKNSRVAAICTFFDAYINGTTQGMLDYKNITLNGALIGANPEQIDALTEDFREELASESRSLSRFKEYAKALDPNEADECYQEFLERINFCESMDELKEFFQAFDLYGDTSTFKRERKYAGVCITTVHSAKGREWDTTYLSLSKFDKPSYHTNRRAFDCSSEHDEVYRKEFVGTTRAKKNLIVTGNYVLSEKRGLVTNRYLEEAYELLGKPFDFSTIEYYRTKTEEHATTAQRSTEVQDAINASRHRMTDAQIPVNGHERAIPTINGEVPHALQSAEERASRFNASHRATVARPGEEPAPVGSAQVAEAAKELDANDIDFE